jgi:hypothetical protein
MFFLVTARAASEKDRAGKLLKTEIAGQVAGLRVGHFASHARQDRGFLLAAAVHDCKCLRCMATDTKEETVSVRITAAEKRSLEADARRKGIPTATVAANHIAEGVRRSRFPAVEFRTGSPGRVAYLAGTRWPVWLIVELVRDYSGKVSSAAKHMNRPAALVQMALDYAAAYPEEIDADLQLAESRCREVGA